jgi:hypothetical protein
MGNCALTRLCCYCCIEGSTDCEDRTFYPLPPPVAEDAVVASAPPAPFLGPSAPPPESPTSINLLRDYDKHCSAAYAEAKKQDRLFEQMLHDMDMRYGVSFP